MKLEKLQMGRDQEFSDVTKKSPDNGKLPFLFRWIKLFVNTNRIKVQPIRADNGK